MQAGEENGKMMAEKRRTFRSLKRKRKPKGSV
jgi:hypothetical protein